jgi:uncharacterized protein (TIGR01732 family)
MCYGNYGGYGYGYPSYGGGFGRNFALIVVLFILLIIVVSNSTEKQGLVQIPPYFLHIK